MTALVGPPPERRVFPRCELPASHYLVRCPFACDTRLDPAVGLTERHAREHLRRDGPYAVVRALVAFHAHHRHVVSLIVTGEASAASNLASDVVEVLADGRVRSLAEIAEAVGEREPVVAAALRRLAEKGALLRPRHGRYRLLAGGKP